MSLNLPEGTSTVLSFTFPCFFSRRSFFLSSLRYPLSPLLSAIICLRWDMKSLRRDMGPSLSEEEELESESESL